MDGRVKVAGRRADFGGITFRVAWILAVLVMVGSGVGYRVLASRLERVVKNPIRLPIPLKAFPAVLDSWEGQEIPIPETVQRVAGNDDFLSRLYRNEELGYWVRVYIAYSAHPRTMLGHRPQVCYPATGWVHDRTEKATVTTKTGREVPCLIHRFHMPNPRLDEVVVLNYYILNGKIIAEESGFDSLSWRTPNIEGNIARYVTQVQISSVLEHSVRMAAQDLTDMVLEYFPDEHGQVRAVELAEERTISAE